MGFDKFVMGSDQLEGQSQKGFPGFTLYKVVDSDRGDSDDFRMSLIRIKPGTGTPRHIHHHSDEAWYVVEGEGIFYADGEKRSFHAKDFLYARRDVNHQLVNTGQSDLIYVAVTAPPCDLKNDQILVEEYDPDHHTTLDPE
jgi:mannose-6-phosphate isomerase-like protein (cupin superfamily)